MHINFGSDCVRVHATMVFVQYGICTPLVVFQALQLAILLKIPKGDSYWQLVSRMFHQSC